MCWRSYNKWKTIWSEIWTCRANTQLWWRWFYGAINSILNSNIYTKQHSSRHFFTIFKSINEISIERRIRDRSYRALSHLLHWYGSKYSSTCTRIIWPRIKYSVRLRHSWICFTERCSDDLILTKYTTGDDLKCIDTLWRELSFNTKIIMSSAW